MKRRRNFSLRLLLAPAFLFLAQACSSDGGIGDPQFSDVACSISQSELLNGGPGKDGIPALTNPDMVSPEDPGASYLLPEDRVVGLFRCQALEGEAGRQQQAVGQEIGPAAGSVTRRRWAS